MLAACEPRLSSCMSWPADVSKILIRVPCNTDQPAGSDTSAEAESQQTSPQHFTHFLGSCSYSCALQVESNAAQRPLMGRDVHRGLFCVCKVHYLYVAWMSARKRQQGVVAVGTQHTQTWGGQREKRSAWSRNSWGLQPELNVSSLKKSRLTFGVVAGLEHM